ncbi:MAG: recombination protein O N-terminal domain-containing protein [Bacilli bacterium]|nr:recombination protein O N-terminal domain-containing protein [Bacilli bacterium]
MILQVEGIVLRARDYKDTSKILDVYVKEKGIIGILSKGCKKHEKSFKKCQ